MLLANREYTVVNFFVIYMAVTQSTLAAGMWFSFSPNIVEATAAANRILSARASSTEEQKPKMPTNDGPAGVEFRDVSFSYTGRDITVLDRINLKIEPGQFAAFVGASGSGKSTMVSLLERFYEPTAGKILFDGVNIADVDASSYRKNLSIVAQESTLYQGTFFLPRFLQSNTNNPRYYPRKHRPLSPGIRSYRRCNPSRLHIFSNP
jgi:ATP-binding cassette subfamily B (MDR/TAP) protein 1